MAKKPSGIELPSTEPVLEQPEPYKAEPINTDESTLTLSACTIFAGRVGIGSDTESVQRRQQAIEFSVSAAFDIAQAVADKRGA